MFKQVMVTHEVPLTRRQRVLNVIRRLRGRAIVAPGLVIQVEVTNEWPRLLPKPKQPVMGTQP
jgi:hypothetical protein